MNPSQEYKRCCNRLCTIKRWRNENAEKILEVQSLYKAYGRNENTTNALNGLSCSVLEGEFLGIMGSSGSGRTTLLNCIAATTLCFCPPNIWDGNLSNTSPISR